MSRTRWISALAAAVGFLAAACWLVPSTFPLAASPQVVTDGRGVTVDVGGAAMLHRTPVPYPESARRNKVQGTVSVEAKLDAAGNVIDTRVLSGPDEVRKQAVMSVFQWHFAAGAAGNTRMVNISFQLPADEPDREVGVPGVVGGVPGGVVGGVPGGVVGGIVGSVPAATSEQQRALTEARMQALRSQIEEFEKQRSVAQNQKQSEETAARIEALRKMMEITQQHPEATFRMGPGPRSLLGRTIKTIGVSGLSDQLKSELLAKLPVHEGDTTTAQSVEQVQRAVREFDEHLSVSWSVEGPDDAPIAMLAITAPGAMPEGPQRIKIGGQVQQAKLIRQPKPVYPSEAKAQGVEGVVSLSVLIAKDGTIQRIEVVSGHPLLVPAALESVRQWVYQTTLLNGNPVEVQTTVDVNFTLLK